MYNSYIKGMLTKYDNEISIFNIYLKLWVNNISTHNKNKCIYIIKTINKDIIVNIYFDNDENNNNKYNLWLRVVGI